MDETIETWIPVVGYEGIYSVSDLGRVRSEPRRRAMKNGRTRGVKGRIRAQHWHKSRKYWCINLSKDGMDQTWDVHVLVLTAFRGPRPEPTMHAAHGDGDSSNCRLGNLRWATPAENCADKIDHGTYHYGEKHGLAKLTEGQVISIFNDSRRQADIAAEHGIAQSVVSRIKNGKRWQHLRLLS